MIGFQTVRFRLVGMVLAVVIAMTAGCTAVIRPTLLYDLRVGQFSALDPYLDGLALGLRSMQLPALLQRSGIVSYRNEHLVDVAPRAAWAVQLDQRATEVIGQNLAQLLNQQRVWIFPWPPEQRPEYQLRVTVDSLAGPLAGPVSLQAHWLLYGDGGKRLLYQGVSAEQVAVEGVGYEGYVAAINTAINRLSSDLAVAVLQHIKPAIKDPS